ncbi:MAG: aminotransferase class III-fold pyridoxal phosphate-dependent enzyme, partial [Alphaproteobacteria bacterium]|nr:aminotransferase class III-fold pyridoxal phosphate-dependent enzyme [Alphaproteobacteria bacterium]
EHDSVTPDVMTLAKGLGGGFPIGACVATRAAAAAMTAGSHASTFGGNPLAMAVANAVLDEVTSTSFLPRVSAISNRLCAGLDALAAAHPRVFAERRGRGLMLGLKCRADSTVMTAALCEAGLLVAPARGDVVRFLPPLVVAESEIDEAIAVVDALASRTAPLAA